MFKIFFLLLLAIPLVELFVLIEVGSEIGALPTIILTVLTAIIGAGLMKNQGVVTMQKAQKSLEVGQAPEIEMLEGVLIFMGGLFLLIPGFITDVLGFLFLIPPIRRKLAENFIAQKRRQQGNVFESEWHHKSADKHVERKVYVHYQSASSNKLAKTDDVIEGELVEDPKPKD